MTARRLVSAILMALLGSAIFTFWVSRRVAKPAVGPVAAQLHYVAALNTLEAGETLEKPVLTLVDWPANRSLVGAFAKAEEVAGRTVLYPLAAGEPILERQLAAPGAGTGLTTRIPQGMRAISLKSDEIVGVAGFLLPGTHVDVLVTYRTMSGQGGAVTSTVLQDTQILAAGQKMQPDPKGEPTTVDVVTLLVTPENAERVVLASSQGVVHFVLRNGSDHEHVADHAAQMAQYGGSGPGRQETNPGPAPAPRTTTAVVQGPKPYVVHTLLGDKQSAETFQ